MMISTSPEEYAQIESLLAQLDPAVPPLVEEIIKIVLIWEEELKRKYPNIAKRGRPIYSSADSLYVTSMETYLRGELSTYSPKTLKLYYENVLKQKSEKINGSEIILEHTMNGYGLKSLKDADESLRQAN